MQIVSRRVKSVCTCTLEKILQKISTGIFCETNSDICWNNLDTVFLDLFTTRNNYLLAPILLSEARLATRSVPHPGRPAISASAHLAGSDRMAPTMRLSILAYIPGWKYFASCFKQILHQVKRDVMVVWYILDRLIQKAIRYQADRCSQCRKTRRRCIAGAAPSPVTLCNLTRYSSSSVGCASIEASSSEDTRQCSVSLSW